MPLAKQDLKKGVFLVVALIALGIAMSLMMGNQGVNYFMIELPGGKQIMAQVADTPEKQVVGLFFAKGLPPDNALLYIYDDEDFHKIWTKNTHFPLDILWMDRHRKILHIEENVPSCAEDPCPAYGPGEPDALYVMQTAAGFVRNNHLTPGMSMIFRLVERG
jgi:uncharacterized protein